jgi:DNA (cytosine-5)-methyltransferase 1
MATDIDIKAKALSAARIRILALQEQMTERVLQMAAEVEKLMEVVSPSEAKTFLKARCNLPSVELSTYVGFAKNLKGAKEVLRTGRTSFPVVKALVAADAETREDVLARIAAGAQIDTRDISTIRKRLQEKKLTVAEAVAQRNRKTASAEARKHAKKRLENFQQDLSSFVDTVRQLPPDQPHIPSGIRAQAVALLADFGDLFGRDHLPIHNSRANGPSNRIAAAYQALRRFSDDRFDNLHGYGLTKTCIGPTAVEALQVMTGCPQKVYGLVRFPEPLTELPPKRYRLRALELCAGAGGMALGLERAGFEHVALIEYDKNAAATLRANRPGWNIIEADVRKVDFTPYREQGIDLLAGGLPCTPYTTVGERKGKKDEDDLLMEGVRAVKQSQPKAFIFENVEGLLHSSHSDHVAEALRKLMKAGYRTEIHRINARDFGVAQDRSRILIVGVRKEFVGAFRMPPRMPEIATNIGDALADLMSASGWSGASGWVQTMREQPFHDRFGNLVQIGALSATMRGRQGVGREKEDARWKRNGFTYAPIPKSAPTDEDAAKEGFVPGLTLPMRARLQDFPDEWEFVGGVGSVAQQIGNAVPVRVAQAVGLAMFSALRGMEFDLKSLLSPVPAYRQTDRLRITAPPLEGPSNVRNQTELERH